MTNNREDSDRGYRLGPDARVVVHRSGRDRHYSVAVVLDEGPYTLEEATLRLAEVREDVGGYVTKADAAHRLGVTERMVDYLRFAGLLDARNDPTNRVMVSVTSINAEKARRESKKS